MSTSPIPQAFLGGIIARTPQFSALPEIIRFRFHEPPFNKKEIARSHLDNIKPWNLSSIKVTRLNLTYSLENEQFSEKTLLKFLKNILISKDLKLQYYIIFKHKIRHCSCITALIFLDPQTKITGKLPTLTQTFIVNNSAPCVTKIEDIRALPWANSYIYTSILANFSLKDAFDYDKPFGNLTDNHLMKGVLQNILYNYKQDLAVVDYQAPPTNKIDYGYFKDMLMARLVADNRFSRLRQDTKVIADKHFLEYTKWFNIKAMRYLLHQVSTQFPWGNASHYLYTQTMAAQYEPLETEKPSILNSFLALGKKTNISESTKKILNFLLRKLLKRRFDSSWTDHTHHLKRLKPYAQISEIQSELDQLFANL